MSSRLYILLMFGCCVVHADMLFTTVSPTPNYQFVGGGSASSSGWIADYFTIDQTDTVSDIGGMFLYQNKKAVFGAILGNAAGGAFTLPSKPLTWYKANIDALTLASAGFTIPSDGGGAIVTVPVAATLQPGTYALVFGAGALGSPTGAVASFAGCCTTDPGNEWEIAGSFPYQTGDILNAYMFVEGKPVNDQGVNSTPEPASVIALATVILGCLIRFKVWRKA